MMTLRSALWLAAAILTGACGNPKATPTTVEEQEAALSADEKVEEGVVRMQRSETSDTVRWGGKTFQYTIVREADETLGTVIDEQHGRPYMDNHIDLRITQGGRTVLNQRFTKGSFHSYLDEGLRQNGLLEGMVFDTTVDGGLQFATSVSYPQSDLYMPLLLIVAPDGGLRIERDELLDTAGANDEEEGV